MKCANSFRIGLDALARAKRASDAENGGGVKRARSSSGAAVALSGDGEAGEGEAEDGLQDRRESGKGASSSGAKVKNYRWARAQDTPSHPGEAGH